MECILLFIVAIIRRVEIQLKFQGRSCTLLPFEALLDRICEDRSISST